MRWQTHPPAIPVISSASPTRYSRSCRSGAGAGCTRGSTRVISRCGRKGSCKNEAIGGWGLGIGGPVRWSAAQLTAAAEPIEIADRAVELFHHAQRFLIAARLLVDNTFLAGGSGLKTTPAPSETR